MKFLYALPVALALLNVASPSGIVAQDKPAVAEKKSTPTILNLNVDQAATVLEKNKDIVVLDVRTLPEFKSGHIHGATNLDFYGDDFEQKLAKLDRQKPYLVHCAVGGRSSKVRDKMKELNFKTIYHLDGGIKAWEKAGKKTEK